VLQCALVARLPAYERATVIGSTPGNGTGSTFSGLRLRCPVHNLGEVDRRLDGIFSPGYSDTQIANHIHDIFLASADQYLAFDVIDRPLIEHWKDLIRAALGPYLGTADLNIIDIGSGAGTSVFPTLELWPRARVIATDLSLPLLSQLLNRANHDGHKSLSVLQMNAEDMVFADQQADVIMGGQVLHHALSLSTTFREIRRVLRTNGTAVFWEGFEGGAQLLARVFDTWMEMDKSHADHLSPGVIDAMLAFTADLQRRKGRSKPVELLKELDDKWYFTRNFVEDLASEAAFSRCEIRNVYGPQNVLWIMTDHELRRWGHGLSAVPKWAQEKLLTIQSGMSDDYLNEHPFSACILMQP
jgi:ubiquinone/menaquinone biosynthesis C-methylase UbiE